jgi:S1-C subfamily serine protease
MHRLLLSFLLLLPLPAAAASPQEIQIENSRAVVYLEIEDESGNFVENGTGFVVSHDGYVVTVAHLKVDPTK